MPREGAGVREIRLPPRLAHRRLAGVLGASFDPLIVGLAAAVAQTFGLATSYGAGAAGLAPMITARFESSRAVAHGINRTADAIRRRGAAAMLLLASGCTETASSPSADLPL